jgi:hypothetical protein
MKITKRLLRKLGACEDAYDAFCEHQPLSDPIKVIDKAMELGRFDWANWLVVRLLDKQQRVKYAILCAEEVLPIFEKEYPDDDRPRKAIEAARAWLKNPSSENARVAAAARAAANAASAADAADAAYAAAYAAADAAASAAARAAAAYAAAAANAASAAAANAASAAAKIKTKIINYGKLLLMGEK